MAGSQGRLGVWQADMTYGRAEKGCAMAFLIPAGLMPPECASFIRLIRAASGSRKARPRPRLLRFKAMVVLPVFFLRT